MLNEKRTTYKVDGEDNVSAPKTRVNAFTKAERKVLYIALTDLQKVQGEAYGAAMLRSFEHLTWDQFGGDAIIRLRNEFADA